MENDQSYARCLSWFTLGTSIRLTCEWRSGLGIFLNSCIWIKGWTKGMWGGRSLQFLGSMVCLIFSSRRFVDVPWAVQPAWKLHAHSEYKYYNYHTGNNSQNVDQKNDQRANVFSHCFPMLGNSSTSLGHLLNNIRNSQVEAFPRSILVIPAVPGPWRRVPVPFLLVRCQGGWKNNHQVMLLLPLMKGPLTLSVSYANLQANNQNKHSFSRTFFLSQTEHVIRVSPVKLQTDTPPPAEDSRRQERIGLSSANMGN